MSGWLKRNSAWQLLQTVATSGSELVVLLAFGSAASAQAFGAFVVVLSATKLTFLVCEPRIHEFLTPKLARYLGRSRRGAWRAVDWARRLELCLNLTAWAVCMVAALTWPRVQASVEGGLIVACGCYNLANTLLKYSSLAIFRCLGEVRIAAWLSAGLAVVKLSLLAAVLWKGVSLTHSLLWLAGASVAFSLAQAGVADRLLHRAAAAPPARPLRALRSENRRRQVRLLLSNYGTGIVEIVHRELDVQIAALFAGVAEAGRYRVAKTMSMVMLEALTPVVTLLLPELARKISFETRIAMTAFLRRVAIYLGALGAASGAVVFAASIVYINWIATSQRGALAPTAILIVTFIVVAPGLWAQAYLVAAGRPHLYLRDSAIGAVVATVLAVLLVPRFGAVGSATAHATGLLLTTILAIWSARYLLRESGACRIRVRRWRGIFG